MGRKVLDLELGRKVLDLKLGRKVLDLKLGRKVLGLEISARTIKIALVQNKARPELLDCSIFNTPENFENGLLSEDEASIGRIALAIEEATMQNRLLTKGVDSVALCVSIPQTIVRPISLPILPDKELDAAVEFELSQSFPGLSKTHVISFKEYSRTKEKVFGIAAFSPRRTLEPYRRLLELLNYKHAYIDVVSNSEAKAYAAFTDIGKSDSVCFLCDMSSNSTQFTVLQGREVLHSRQIGEGMGVLREIFRDTLGLEASRFEQPSLEDISDADIPESELSTIFRAVYAPILDQLQQTIEFYNVNSGGQAPIAEVLLIGGGSVFPKLDEYFSAVLGLPVSLPAVPENDKIDRFTFIRSFSAIGAAIRED